MEQLGHDQGPVQQGVVVHLAPWLAASLVVCLGLLVALSAGWVFQTDLSQSQLVRCNHSLLGRHLVKFLAIFQLVLFLALVLPQAARVGLLQPCLPACCLLVNHVHCGLLLFGPVLARFSWPIWSPWPPSQRWPLRLALIATWLAIVAIDFVPLPDILQKYWGLFQIRAACTHHLFCTA